MYLMTCLDGCCSVTFQPTVSKSRCKCKCTNYEEGSVFHRLWQHAAKLNRKKDMRGHVCQRLTDPLTGQRLFQPMVGRKSHHDVIIPWPPQFPSLAFDNPSYQNTYEIWELQSLHCKLYTCLFAYQLLKNITHIISSWNWLWVFRYFAEIVTHFLYFCSTAEEPKTAPNWGVFVSIEIQYWQAKGGVAGARSCKKERASRIPSYVMQV